jgi:hypothetical protein
MVTDAPTRNDACHCGSGEKYKRCHLRADEAEASPEVSRRALLRTLGYHPDTHGIWNVQHPIPGIRVVDAQNEPIKFFAEQAVRKLFESDDFLEPYGVAVAQEVQRVLEGVASPGLALQGPEETH